MNFQQSPFGNQPPISSPTAPSDLTGPPSTSFTSERSFKTGNTRVIWTNRNAEASPSDFQLGQIIYSPVSVEDTIKQAVTAQTRHHEGKRYEQFAEHHSIPLDKVRPCVVLLIRQEQEDPLIVCPITRYDGMDWRKLKDPELGFSFPIDNDAFLQQNMNTQFKAAPFKIVPPFIGNTPQYIVAVRLSAHLLYVRPSETLSRSLQNEEGARLLDCCENLIPSISNAGSPLLEGFERVSSWTKKRPLNIVRN